VKKLAVEIGELGRLVTDGANEGLSLCVIELDLDCSHGERSFNLVGDRRVPGEAESPDEVGGVASFDWHASHIYVAPQRHV